MGFIKNALVNGDVSLYSYGRTMSFPSSFNKGGNQLNLQGMKAANLAKAQLLMAGGELVSAGVNKLMGKEGSVEDEVSNKNIKSVNINLNTVLRQQMYDDAFINFGRYAKRIEHRTQMPNIKSTMFEELHLPGEFLQSMNSYRFSYKETIWESMGVEKATDSTGNHILSKTSALPSLFNPKYGIQQVGMVWNVPLLNNNKNDKRFDVSDCSIKKLVALSNKGLLGSETFRLVDFMYCKDLGKVSNNHLITLRKFPLPVPDHIGEGNSPNYRADSSHDAGVNIMGDVAHLVTWFGTEDNKLEDIIKFNYEVEYIEKSSKIQEITSKEDDPERGPMGKFINTFAGFLGGDYYTWVEKGTAGTQNLWASMLGGKVEKYKIARDAGDQLDKYRNYDNNKVYEPMNTTRDMSMPSGALKFNHEFTITFSYKLRAYDNINPRSAFTDLIGNILECTYNRGRWWGGKQKIVGPKPNHAAWKKAENFIDNAWDKMGGLMAALSAGGAAGVLADVLGSIANAGKEVLDQMKNGAQAVVSSLADGGAGAAAAAVKDLAGKAGLGIFAKSAIHNALGRPAFYAFDSLLSGEPTGLWHVTIGNPRAPIMSIGNLRITNTSFQMGGPLGIDGFPSEIKVAVTLKHCRARDVSEISRMFANGLSPIYYPTAGRPLSKFYGAASNYSNDNNEAPPSAPDGSSKNNVEGPDASEEEYKKNLASARQAALHDDEAQAALMKTDFAFNMWHLNDYVLPSARVMIDEVA